MSGNTQTQNLVAQIRTLFDGCLDQDPHNRDAYLIKAAAGNKKLVAEVRALLVAHDRAESLDPIGAVLARETSHIQQLEPLPLLDPGRRLADFVIIRKLGAGGFGDVYLALQFSLGRNIALKITRKDSPEARTMARLKHANIVQVHAAMRLQEIDAPAICMQYVPGITLGELLAFIKDTPDWNGRKIIEYIDECMQQEKAFGTIDQSTRARFEAFDQLEVISHFIIKTAQALNYAHSMNVLHLDVKPSNILLDLNGDALLTDFNVSLRQDRPGEMNLGGTPEYMAPEILNIATGFGTSASLDGRADIYSLGIVIKKLLACVTPNRDSMYLQNLAESCTAVDAFNRFSSGAEVAATCVRQQKLKLLQKQLDAEQQWWLYRWGLRWPRFTIYAALILPNIVASIFQVYYNQIHIMGPLSQEQRIAFTQMLAPLNSVVYLYGFFLAWWFYRDFFKVASRLSEPLTADARAAARRSLIRTPFLALALISMNWIISGFLVVVGLDLMTGNLPDHSVYHFVVSFGLAMAIPLGFCFLNIGYLNIVAFYPRLLTDVVNLSTTIEMETKKIRKTMKAFRFWAGGVPLIGAAVAVLQGPGSDPQSISSYPYQYLVIAFIVVGIIGMVFAVHVVDRFDAAITRLNEASL